MIWAKTDAGRVEMQAKALIKERAQRNLLLLIDGQKTEEMLLTNLAGISPGDFEALEAMGLIEPVTGSSGRGGASRPTSVTVALPLDSIPAPIETTELEVPLDYAHFTETLTKLISKELGLRGFTLTLAVEKASTIEQLMDVANRTIDQIRERKGAPVAEQARRALYGS